MVVAEHAARLRVAEAALLHCDRAGFNGIDKITLSRNIWMLPMQIKLLGVDVIELINYCVLGCCLDEICGTCSHRMICQQQKKTNWGVSNYDEQIAILRKLVKTVEGALPRETLSELNVQPGHTVISGMSIYEKKEEITA